MIGRASAHTAVAALVATLLCGCGASARRVEPTQTVAAPNAALRTTVAPHAALRSGPPTHIAVILMENKEYGDIIGSPQTPFINALVRRYALARSMYATTHPSLPNYLALTGGSTFGIDSDCTDCRVTAAQSLASQLSAAHLSWTAYMEDMPHPCYRGAGAGDYAKKHDPFMYYDRIAGNPAMCRHVVPLTLLAVDERVGTLPRFAWITPNLCHDMHDCSPAQGDAFLAHLVPPLLTALGRHGLLFVTWDEGTTDNGCCRLAMGGHIPTILAGPAARLGARLKTPTDQYSILQTVEDVLGLRRLRGAACVCTPSLAPLLTTAPPRRSSATYRRASG